MGHLLYLMIRCDRGCDEKFGKFGNFVVSKHTRSPVCIYRCLLARERKGGDAARCCGNLSRRHAASAMSARETEDAAASTSRQ